MKPGRELDAAVHEHVFGMPIIGTATENLIILCSWCEKRGKPMAGISWLDIVSQNDHEIVFDRVGWRHSVCNPEGLDISHGICPDCAQKMHDGIFENSEVRNENKND